MTDTLQCGHPASYLYRHPSVGYGCIACHQTPIAIRRYAGELCGVDVTESDPIDFAKAIVDDPDSPLPRLVFADWLDEQGDPRGELIRVESELAEDDNCSYCHGRGEIINHNGEGSLCPACYGEKKVMRPPGRSRCKCEQCQRYKDLLDRRTALRRQLGYDQPAEPEEVPCYDCRGTGIASRLGTGGVCIECDGTGKVRINA